MPMIRGRYYANPAYGEAMERAREAELESDGEDGARHQSGRAGEVHHIHILRHAGGVSVHVHHHGPGSEDAAPSGQWSTHNFERDDHDGVGQFVTSVLARSSGKPTGQAPFARS